MFSLSPIQAERQGAGLKGQKYITAQNLIWATDYNVIALPVAAGILAPVGIILSPALGAVLMSLSTVIVALNAQLLRLTDLSSDTS